MDRSGAQQPDGRRDHGCGPKVAPNPVAQYPQGAYGEVRHCHLGLEWVARGPADGFGDLLSEERMADERPYTSESNVYHEEPQQQDFRYSPTRPRLLIVVEVKPRHDEAENEEDQEHLHLAPRFVRLPCNYIPKPGTTGYCSMAISHRARAGSCDYCLPSSVPHRASCPARPPPERLMLGLKVWPAKNYHKDELLPELLITGAGIPTTVGTTASTLVLKGIWVG